MKKFTILVGIIVSFSILVIGYESNLFQAKESECNSTTSNQEEDISVILNADYQNFNTLSELVQASDIIIECTSIKSDVTSADVGLQSNVAQTTSIVKVSKIYKGVLKNRSTLSINQLGGILGSTSYSEKDSTILSTNQKYILFLRTFDDIPEFKGSPADIINPIQGIYIVNSDGSIKPVNPENTFHLTADYLKSILR